MDYYLDGEPPIVIETKRSTSTTSALKLYFDLINKGICELCGARAPFCDSDGAPYLQKYFIRRPSLGGLDEPNNIAFLCPNCFAKMTVLNRPEDVEKIRQNMENRPKLQSDADEYLQGNDQKSAVSE